MSTLRPESTTQQSPSILCESVRAIERCRPIVFRIDFQVQGDDPEPAPLLQGKVDDGGSDAAASRRGHQIEVVDETVAAAVLDAVAQGDDEIADHMSGAADDPAPCHGLPRDDPA